MAVVGNVEPVSDAAASFQVGGQVATVTVTPGQQVTAGQTLGTLDTTALSETVSSAQSTRRRRRGEAGRGRGEPVERRRRPVAPRRRRRPRRRPRRRRRRTAGTTAARTPPSPQDQTTLTQDEATLVDGSATRRRPTWPRPRATAPAPNTGTTDRPGHLRGRAPDGLGRRAAGLQGPDGGVQGRDRAGAGPRGRVVRRRHVDAARRRDRRPGARRHRRTPGSAPPSAARGHRRVDATRRRHGSGQHRQQRHRRRRPPVRGTGSGIDRAPTRPSRSRRDQADIDTRRGELTNAEQSLNEATLTSPISGTVVSVGHHRRATRSAPTRAPTIITIIGTKSYEVTGDARQLAGPLGQGRPDAPRSRSTASTARSTAPSPRSVRCSRATAGYTYPVVVALPDVGQRRSSPGRRPTSYISTGAVSNVVAVPTSAVADARHAHAMSRARQGRADPQGHQGRHGR